MQSAKTDKNSAGSEPPREKRVGEMLRDARLEKDQNLKTVSDMLKIRLPYLEAIEESRPGDLPGTTYAIGFVRAYSDHLGLETPRMVEQFKKEAAELENQTALHFPEPLPGGRVPGGAILFVCVLLVGLIYGAWMFLSSQGRPIAEIVPAIPEQLSSLVGLGDGDAEEPSGDPVEEEEAVAETASPAPVDAEEPVATAEPEASDSSAATPEPVTETVPPLDEEVAETAAAAEAEAAQAGSAADEAAAQAAAQAAEAAENLQAQAATETEENPAADVGETVEAAAAEVSQTVETTVSTAAETTAEAAETVATEAAPAAADINAASEEAVAAATEPVTETEAPATAEAAAEEVSETAEQAENVAEEATATEVEETVEEPAAEASEAVTETEVAAVADPSPPAPPATPGGPKVYGEENADARVVITAESAAWVEITAPSGELVLTRLLNTGDSYRVPNTDGLTLVTGNAGGLQITVDGEAVAPIGPVGSVRRDVLLEPDALKTRDTGAGGTQ